MLIIITLEKRKIMNKKTAFTVRAKLSQKMLNLMINNVIDVRFVEKDLLVVSVWTISNYGRSTPKANKLIHSYLTSIAVQ